LVTAGSTPSALPWTRLVSHTHACCRLVPAAAYHPQTAGPQSRSLDGESLAPLTRLRELHLEDCGLRSLGGVPRLGALTLLAAGGNRLGDTGELERVAAVASLREARLAGNPIARRPVRA
jgi:hypothetical protein